MRTVEENGFYVSGGYQNIPPQNIIPLSVEFPRQTNLQSNLFRPSDSDFCETSSSMNPSPVFSEPPSFYPPGVRVGGMPHHHQQQPPVFRDYSMTPPPPQRYESLVIQPPQQTITQFMAESAPAYTYHPDNYITASSMSWTDSERLSDESFQSSYQSLASFKGDERPSSYR
eukprot:gene13460-14805_t